MLSFGYYKDIFLIISKHAKAKFAEEKKELINSRRKFLKEGNQAEYRSTIETLVQQEERSFGDLMTEAMDHLGLTE